MKKVLGFLFIFCSFLVESKRLVAKSHLVNKLSHFTFWKHVSLDSSPR